MIKTAPLPLSTRVCLRSPSICLTCERFEIPPIITNFNMPASTNILKAYIHQLETLYDGGNWVAVSARNILNDISYEKAIEKLHHHSIYEIIAHLLVWRLFLLHRLLGDDDYNIQQNGPLDWQTLDNSSPEDWQNLLEAYYFNQIELVAILKSKNEEILQQIVPTRDYTFGHLINGTIQHEYYHLGQVALLKR